MDQLADGYDRVTERADRPASSSSERRKRPSNVSYVTDELAQETTEPSGPAADGGATIAPERSRASEPDLDDPSLYFNRELSWLDFNERVLELAEDPRVPLLERVNFCAIYADQPRRVLHGPGRRPLRPARRRRSTRAAPTGWRPPSRSTRSAQRVDRAGRAAQPLLRG